MPPESEQEVSQQSNNVITLVVTADNHLGYSGFAQQPRKNEAFQRRLRRAFQQATDFAIGQGVDLFIQAGDLFATANPSEQERSFVAARLAQLRQAGVRTFALGGLHDTPSENAPSALFEETHGESAPPTSQILAPQESFARLGALHYFSSNASDIEPVIVEIRGARVGLCGLGVSAGQEGDALASAHISSDIERADIPVLIMHAPIEGLSARQTSLENRAEVSRASIECQSAFRVILAGYHHQYHHQRLGECELIVAGATQYIDFQDVSAAPEQAQEDDDAQANEAASAGAPGFVFIGLAPEGLRWCRHIAVDALKMRQLTIQTSDLWSDDPTGQTPTEIVLERLRPLCDAGSLVQLRLEGALTREKYHQLNLNQLRRFGEETCFALTIDDSALELLADDAESSILQRLSAREELIALADEWIAAADEQEQHALRATKEELLAAMDSR
jgi:hypothetical protein